MAELTLEQLTDRANNIFSEANTLFYEANSHLVDYSKEIINSKGEIDYYDLNLKSGCMSQLYNRFETIRTCFVTFNQQIIFNQVGELEEYDRNYCYNDAHELVYKMNKCLILMRDKDYKHFLTQKAPAYPQSTANVIE